VTQKNEIQTTEQQSPNEMIRLAIENNADLDKLEKLLELAERYDASQAKKVYASDFAVVQANIEAVLKTKKNKQTNSNYAGLESVIEVAKPVYTEQGFSVIYYEGKADKEENIRVCADVLHRDGHQKTYHLDVPLDGEGIKGTVNKTKIHAKASSVTYCRRILLCMIWNIPTQDDDGNSAGEKEPIKFPKPSDEEMQTIAEICALMKPDPGLMVDPVLAAKVFYANRKEYPPSDCDKLKAATWLWKLNPSIYKEDNRDALDKQLGLPGDEDSQPDHVECRYVCVICDNEFDALNKDGNCPNCTGSDVTDRRPE